MTNFLSLKEMFRISLQGKPIFGVSLKIKYSRKHIKLNFESFQKPISCLTFSK